MSAQQKDLGSVTRSLMIPLVIVTLVSALVIGVLVDYLLRHRMTSALDAKSKLVTQTVAEVLGDPLAMGEYDHLQKIIATAKSFDSDMSYAYLVSPDGRVLASTDPSKKNSMLDASKPDRDALTCTDLMVIETGDGTLEVDKPVISAGVKAGILRMGFSNAGIKDQVLTIDSKVIAAVIMILWGSSVVYLLIVRKTIIAPLLAGTD